MLGRRGEEARLHMCWAASDFLCSWPESRLGNPPFSVHCVGETVVCTVSITCSKVGVSIALSPDPLAFCDSSCVFVRFKFNISCSTSSFVMCLFKLKSL